MDFWIPLIGGAVGAAIINGVVALYKLSRDKHDEHWQWLRNEKKKEYIAAVESMSEMTSALAGIIRGKPGNLVSTDSSFVAPINVLGSQKLKKAMREVTNDMAECVKILTEPKSEDTTIRARSAHDKLSETYSAFLKAVRDDLGVKD